MKNFKRLLIIAGVSLAFAVSGGRAAAQGFGGGAGGAFDPSQLYQTIVDNQRDALSVTNDDDWKAISPRLLKVVQLQLQTRTTGMRGMFAGMGRGRGGGGGGGGGGPFGGEEDPAEAALQKALDDHAPIADVKAAMARVRAVRQQKQAEVAKAQADLRDLLTSRQEAVLLAAGLLE